MVYNTGIQNESFRFSGPVSIKEGNYTALSGANRIAEESYRDMVGIIESIAKIDALELRYMKEGIDVSEMYVTEAFGEKVKAAFQKIKEFLKKLWEKIKTFFKNLAIYFNAMFLDANKFIKKYSAELGKLSSKKVKLMGYEYNFDIFKAEGVKSSSDKSVKKVDEYISEIRNTVNATIDAATHRTTIKDERGIEHEIDTKVDEKSIRDGIEKLNDSAIELFIEETLNFKTTEDDWEKDLEVELRNGDKEKSEITVRVSDAVKTIKDFSKKEKELRNSEKNFNSAITNTDKAIDKLAKEYDKANKTIYTEVARTVASMQNTIATAGLKTVNLIKIASKEQINQCKTVCSMALRGKTEDK